MGKRRIILSMTIGAVVGGAVALFDKNTRSYAKGRFDAAKSCSSHFISNPSEAIHSLRNTFDELNQTIASGAENAINALEQVESTLEKVTNKNGLN